MNGSFIKVKSLPLILRFFLLPLFFYAAKPLLSAEGEFRFSTYFDSNMLESVRGKIPTQGFKLRGKYKYRMGFDHVLTTAEILTQAFLDSRHSTESKLVVKARGDLKYQFRPEWFGSFRLLHFRKIFPNQQKTFIRSGGGSSLYYSGSSRVLFWVATNYRWFQYSLPDTFRFSITDMELGSEVFFRSKISCEGLFSVMRVMHKDLHVIESFHDSSLIMGNPLRRDRVIRGTVHIKYKGNWITGLKITRESILSNSLINSSDAISLEFYLSGFLTRKTYYHLLVNYTDKRYENSIPAYYTDGRDPEDQQQNRFYLRLEHFFRRKSVVFFQFNLLKNETIFNSIYYNKILVEFGIKYIL